MAVSMAAAAVLEKAWSELGTPVFDVPFKLFNEALRSRGISVADRGNGHIRFTTPEQAFEYNNNFTLRVGAKAHAVHSAEHPMLVIGVELKWEIRYEGVDSYFTPFGFEAFDEAAAVAALLYDGRLKVDLPEPLVEMPIPPWIAGGQDWIHDTGTVAPESKVLTLVEARTIFDEWKTSVETALRSR